VGAAPEEREGATEGLADLFMELAAIPSPSRKEGEVAARVRNYLADLGLEVYEDKAGEGFGGECGNLWCRVPGVGAAPQITLGAHLDTVLPTDAIRPEMIHGVIRNAKPTILGADNKVAVACLLHVIRLLQEGEAEHATFDLLFSVGEEIGLQGAKHLDRERLESPMGLVFDSSGTVGGIVTQAPSQQTMQAFFRGKAAHAGLVPEEGRSAIQAAALAIADMELGRLDERTTANVGVIEGGMAGNIVPEKCRVRAECRSLDDDRLAEVVAQMVTAFQSGAARTGCEVDIDLIREYQGFTISSRAPVLRLVREALSRIGVEPHTHGSGGGSDANVLNELGVPTLNLDCGMQKVHTSEEEVSVNDLHRVAAVVMEVVKALPTDA